MTSLLNLFTIAPTLGGLSSFRPGAAIVPLRSYLRQRKTLVEEAATRIQRMQKALTEMYLSFTQCSPTATRAPTILRCSAMSLGKTSTSLGAFYRPLAVRAGRPKAITATARKLHNDLHS